MRWRIALNDDGIEAFVDYWETLPLFASQQQLASDIRSALRSQRLRNLPGGLANSLRGMGTGTQPSLWERLPELKIPTLLMAGELDTKFVGIASQMYDLLPEAQMMRLCRRPVIRFIWNNPLPFKRRS